MATIHLEIVTPSRKVLEANCSEVYLPGQQGEFGILPEHEGLVTKLSAGVVRYVSDGGRKLLAIQSGFAQVLENRVIVLTDDARKPEEINREELQTRWKAVEQKLLFPSEGENRQALFHEASWCKAWEEVLSN